MTKLLITLAITVAALSIASTTHADAIFERHTRATVTKMPHKNGETNCKLYMEVEQNRIHTRSNCWERDAWLRTHHSLCTEDIIDRVERQDDVSFLEYAHCHNDSIVFLHTLVGSDLAISKTEYY
jgi:hypothetical protein